MTFTTIIVSTLSLTQVQKDFLIKLGFSIMGVTFSKNIKTDNLHIIIRQIAQYNIPFKLQTNAPLYSSKPCNGCRK